MRQDLILSRLRQRAAILTRAERLVRTWFGVELADLITGTDRDAGIKRLRAAIPELAAQPAAVPLAGSPAPVD